MQGGYRSMLVATVINIAAIAFVLDTVDMCGEVWLYY